MVKGSSGAWDDNQMYAPAKPILKDGVYYMYYTGGNTGGVYSIGFATSTDLVNWTKFGSNPVIQDGVHAIDQFIYQENGIYYIFYTHTTDQEYIKYATSTDLINWSSTATTTARGEGTIIYKIGSTYYLFSAVGYSGSGEYYKYWTSTDLINWTDNGKIGIVQYSWDSGAFGHGDILYDSNNYYLFFQGTNDGGSTFKIGLASSTDLIGWNDLNLAGDSAWPIDNGELYQNTGVASTYNRLFQNIDNTNYVFDANIKYVDTYNVPTNRGIGGIMCNSQGTTNNYFLELHTQNDKLTLWKIVDNSWTNLSQVSFDSNRDQYYKLTLEANNGTIKAYVDGVLKITVNDSAFLSGKIGLITYASKAKFDNMKVRKFTSPEPSASFGSEEAYTITAPITSTPIPLSSSAIRWNFTCDADNETGFRVYTNADVEATSSATANLAYLDETGLSENTQYTRYVKAYNSYGESASSSATSTYTLVDTPTNLALTAQSTTQIDNSVDTFPNHSSGQSGYYFANITASTNSGWQAGDNTWSETTLSPNTQYTYTAKYRNGSSTETSTIQDSKYTLIQTPTAISFDTITTNSLTISASGTLSNLASSTSGVYFDETSGNMGGSDSSWQQTTSYQNTGLSENTLYTYQVKARNGDETATSYTSTSSKYTLADTPTGFNFERHPNSLNIYVDSFPNPTSGSSGYLFWRTDNSAYNSGWIQTNEWQDLNMVQGTTYTYAVKYRNGDGIETATTTLSGVSFTRDNSGGGTPTIQPQATTTATSTQNTTTTTTANATSTQQTSTSTIPNLAGLTGQARQIVIQQIKAQIAEIQKKIIILINQLIQLLQEQLRVQLQGQH